MKASLLGGGILGLLSSIPLVGLGCCLWAIIGGALSVIFYKNFTNKPVDTGTGAILGLLAGVFGAVITTVLGTILNLVLQSALYGMGLSGMAVLEDQFAGPGMAELMQPGFTILGMFLNLLIYLIIFGIFSTLGGLITAVLMNNKSTGSKPAPKAVKPKPQLEKPAPPKA